MILEETEPNLFVEILLILTNSQRPLISTEIIYSFQKYFGQNDCLCKVSGLWGKTNQISGSKCFVQAGAGKSCFGLKKILIKLVPYMNLQIWRFPGGFFCFSLLFSFAFRSNYAFEYISNTKQIIQYIVSPDSGTQRVGMYKLFTAKLVLEKMREGKNSCRRLERKSKVFLYQLCKAGNQNKIIILESNTKNSQGVVLCSPYNQCWHVIRFTFEHHRVPGEQISIVIQWGSKSTQKKVRLRK